MSNYPSVRKNTSLFLVILAGCLAGLASAFFKWGWEVPFPPRAANRVSPPGVLLAILQGHPAEYLGSPIVSDRAIMLVHTSFAVASGIFYAVVSRYWPKIRLWWGIGFGLFIYIAFHIIIMPIMHLTPAPWDLPGKEHASEIFGHIFWGLSIDLIFIELLHRFRKHFSS